ncbi:MAG: transcriptional repressor [Bacteroides sp.]|nr:transcriptional repressor [Bacteroides sp.]MCM1378571.1 transcriptional repressor [Bacteroides sp.]MCM1444872.1 transcriptional repressor [Prevotella sp.]
MEKSDIERILENHGVRPTAVRILIYKAAENHANTFNLMELEEELDTIDKSTIFRTLTLFAEHHLLHETEDGSGSKKYCVCHHDHECALNERHVHFYCTRCHTSYCLEHTFIPSVKIPEGYTATDAEYVIKGICPKCAE